MLEWDRIRSMECFVFVRWVLVAAVVVSSSSYMYSKLEATRAKQEDGRRSGRSHTSAFAFFSSHPERRDESERGTKPLQREQACRTTARNYFGDNLPVSILRGRFGQGLRLRRSASSTKGQDRDRGHCPSQALSSLLAGNMLTFAPS